MKRNTRAQKAQETLDIIERGFYHAGEKNITIEKQLIFSVENSKLYTPADLDILQEETATRLTGALHQTAITVQNTTVLAAAAEMVRAGKRPACLNFASAKNPGGGFLGGAQAQEESLAMSSTLYPTLMQHFAMYTYNRNRSTLLYSDHMIYSPGVVVIRDDEGDLLSEPYEMDLVTSPAVNIGAMKQNHPEELAQAEAVMLGRMDKMLALFMAQGAKHLLLGAWGCGVFRNDPEDIARYFAGFLLPGGKYSRCFESVVFAVLDRSEEGANITAFRKHFS